MATALIRQKTVWSMLAIPGHWVIGVFWPGRPACPSQQPVPGAGLILQLILQSPLWLLHPSTMIQTEAMIVPNMSRKDTNSHTLLHASALPPSPTFAYAL